MISQCLSSIRYKENVNNYLPGLDLIRRLRPVSFNWKQGWAPDMGLIAEEVAEVEPLLTTRDSKGEIMGVKYDRVAVVLLNAVKEQQAQIQNQQREIEMLKKLACTQQPKSSICNHASRASTATRRVRAISSAK
ncbi:MAG TPA: tail fiber domain-containing protein [Blastocatellia bacterium]|nr:tail fiber domain-containing protein [Blastocatellia bacterium]